MANRKIVTVHSMDNTVPEDLTFTETSELAKKIKEEINKRDLAPGTTLSTHFQGSWSPRPTTREDITVQWIGGSVQPSEMFNGDIWFKELEGSDTTPPTTPTGLATYDITASGMSVSWNGSTDASGISGYEVFVGGVLKSATSNEWAVLTNLLPDTEYSITVRATDTVGNHSAVSEPLLSRTNSPVIGDTHSIFGSTEPTSIPAYHNDGDPSIIAATGFYTTGDSVDWSCVGGRQYIPSGSALVGSEITIGMFLGDSNLGSFTGPNLENTPLRSGTVTAVSGWNEVTWSPYVLTPGLPAVYISMTANTNEYVSTTLPTDASIPSPTSGNRLHMAESSGDNPVRSVYRLDTSPTAKPSGNTWYGQDVIVSESGA